MNVFDEKSQKKEYCFNNKYGPHRWSRDRHALHHRWGHRSHTWHLREGLVQVDDPPSAHHSVLGHHRRDRGLHAVGHRAAEEEVRDAHESVRSCRSQDGLAKDYRVGVGKNYIESVEGGRRDGGDLTWTEGEEGSGVSVLPI